MAGADRRRLLICVPVQSIATGVLRYHAIALLRPTTGGLSAWKAHAAGISASQLGRYWPFSTFRGDAV
jgi:hypothetical protein